MTLVLPSKGAIAQPTLDFLKGAGLHVRKPNPRQYAGTMTHIPELNILFQRVKDVAYKVADGTAQLGVTGYDVVCEHPHDDLIVVHEQLGYGHCQLVVAVPESWVDVTSIVDLADVALEFRDRHQRNLRIATTYTNLTRQFMHQNGIHHFSLVRAEGAIEAAPTTGYADVIVDLTQTGTTLRENHLRSLRDGVIVKSQACLIANRKALNDNTHLLHIVESMLEYIDAAMMGRKYLQLTINICGESAEAISSLVASNDLTRGLLGPTISPVYDANLSGNDQWFTVTITIEHQNLHKAVHYLRSIGASQIITVPVEYLFTGQSLTFKRLLDRLAP